MIYKYPFIHTGICISCGESIIFQDGKADFSDYGSGILIRVEVTGEGIEGAGQPDSFLAPRLVRKLGRIWKIGRCHIQIPISP
jgi:hypothetical protein